VQIFNLDCKSPNLIGETVEFEVIVASNISTLTFSIDFGDGTQQTFSLSGIYF
jgi:hypothetical protein